MREYTIYTFLFITLNTYAHEYIIIARLTKAHRYPKSLDSATRHAPIIANAEIIITVFLSLLESKSDFHEAFAPKPH